MARILAASTDNIIRDGKTALEHALEAYKHDVLKHWPSIEAVAASYAELGKFDEAITWQKKAIESIPAQAEGIKKRAEERLKQYNGQKPLRYKTSKEWR